MQPSTTLSTKTDFHSFPFGGMDRREDQIVLVEQRHACLVVRRVRRIERKFGQERLPGRITVLDLLELDQIGVTGDGIFVDAVEMRFIPEARLLQFRRPPRSARVQINDCFDEGGPVCGKADAIVSIMSQLG